MSIDSIRNAMRVALTDNNVSRSDVLNLLTAANDSGTIDAGEKAELQQLFTQNESKFSTLAKQEFARLFGTQPAPVIPVPPPTLPTPVVVAPVAITPAPVVPPAPVVVPAPVTTAQPETMKYEANRKPWTTTYWPMAGNGNADGSASANLWAKDGALAKFDSLLKAEGKSEGAREFELKPNLNWLVGKEGGHYVPNSSLSEKDAETTTGVDFNNNGTIDKDVAFDFVDSRGNFGQDGKTEGTMNVGWWGSCDKVARAGILFEEPKKDVTLNGVTFTTQDIKGLLTVIADSQGGRSDFVGNRYDAKPDTLTLKNGQRLEGAILTEMSFGGAGSRRNEDFQTAGTLPAEIKIKLMDGTEKTFPASEIQSAMREDKRDDAAMFHETIGAWLKSGRPAVMDKDSGEHVWNYNFFKAEDTIYKGDLKPNWAGEIDFNEGFNGPKGDGTITFVERNVQLGGGGSTERYKYWIEEKNGKVVNSGWAKNSSSPDFLWRPQTEASFTGTNARNPFVDPAMVKALYEASIAP